MQSKTAKTLHPELMHPAQMHDLIVRKQELYPEARATEARRAMAQSLAWTAGAVFHERRLVGRALDCRRATKVWNKSIELAAEEIKSETQLDPALDTQAFVIALATEYSRILQGPDTERLKAVHCEVEKEPLVPRMPAIQQYGARLVGDSPYLVQHYLWLESLSEKQLI